MSKSLRAPFLLFASSVFFMLSAAYAKIATGKGANPLAFAALSIFIGALAYLYYMAFRGRLRVPRFRGEGLKEIAAAGILSSGVAQVLFFYGVSRTSVTYHGLKPVASFQSGRYESLQGRSSTG
jgi:drug/metabolite transporter (DMT)-like permease